jgi:hypothetical protein
MAADLRAGGHGGSLDERENSSGPSTRRRLVPAFRNETITSFAAFARPCRVTILIPYLQRGAFVHVAGIQFPAHTSPAIGSTKELVKKGGQGWWKARGIPIEALPDQEKSPFDRTSRGRRSSLRRMYAVESLTRPRSCGH